MIIVAKQSAKYLRYVRGNNEIFLTTTNSRQHDVKIIMKRSLKHHYQQITKDDIGTPAIEKRNFKFVGKCTSYLRTGKIFFKMDRKKNMR